MKKSILIGLAIGLLGCQGQDNIQDTGITQCPVTNTDVVAYQTCKGASLNGYECVTGCGRRPDDGGDGTVLPAGCTVQIGTSTQVTALCVSSCSECN